MGTSIEQKILKKGVFFDFFHLHFLSFYVIHVYKTQEREKKQILCFYDLTFYLFYIQLYVFIFCFIFLSPTLCVFLPFHMRKWS